MKLFILILVTLLTTACGHTPRTKWTDKTMRIAIVPAAIDAGNYVRIQQALVASDKFVVVDRAIAFNAIKSEQEQLHRTDADRFMDKEKFAIWGRMLGVGGVVVAHAQCQNKENLFNRTYTHCHQFLSIVDTNTGEVMATAEDTQNSDTGEDGIAPSWEDAVAKLIDAYPARFEPSKDKKELLDYKDLAKEEAQRQKEAVAKAEGK